MTLRTRTLLSIAMTLVALIMAIYALSRIIVLGSFIELEERLARRSVAQVVSVVQEAASTVDTLTLDWAAWDDTYAFVQDQNPAYIESNLVDETFSAARINFMVFVDAQGHIVYAKGYDFYDMEPIPVPNSLTVHLSGDMPLTRYTETDQSHAGILLLPEGPLLAASRPIMTSQEAGPIQGALVMARYLDEVEIGLLSESILTQFVLRRFADIPLDVQVALQMGEPLVVFPVDSEYLVGYGLLRNIYGEPTLAIEEIIPRDIYRQGLRSISYLVSALLMTGVVFGAVMLWMLERSVLVRLSLLSVTVDTIGAQEDLSVRVSLSGKDELAQLGRAINGMLEALEQAQRRRAEVEQALREYTRQLEARNEELDAFAHTVAHDLKNPLSTIVGFSAVLEENGSLATEERQRALDIISRTGHRMIRIIEELLLLASIHRIEDVPCEPLDMAGIVAAVQDRMALSLSESAAVVILPEQWPMARGYTAWIEEVWANYLSNAIKYGGAPARIELGATRQPEGLIRFWIRDNGAGLSPEEQARLFTPFTRLKQIRVRGHGLGLSIVRRIMDKLGGAVGVESALGEGSTFWFTLPADAESGS